MVEPCFTNFQPPRVDPYPRDQVDNLQQPVYGNETAPVAIDLTFPQSMFMYRRRSINKPRFSVPTFPTLLHLETKQPGG